MLKRLCIVLFASIHGLPGLIGSVMADELLADRFESFFEERIEEEGILGAAFAIVEDGKILRLGVTGYTDTTRQHEIDADTVFRVASVSKTFAAGLAGILEAEGSFQWDDPVRQHVSAFQINGDSNRIRVRHLLGQSTGLMPHAYDNLIEDGVPLVNIQKQFSQLSYICAPGTCYSYQNSIFSMIEPVIEQSTHRKFADLMQSRVFDPLDMTTASVGYEPFVNNENHAKPHVQRRKGLWVTVDVLPNYYRIPSAAGVNASALDMGKWLMAQMGSHPDVIAPEVVDNLIRPRVRTKREIYRRHWNDLITDAHYGLGWRVYQMGEREIAYHSGWVSGYRADLAWSPEEKLGIAVLMNAESRAINEITTRFWAMVPEPGTPASASVTPGTAPSADIP